MGILGQLFGTPPQLLKHHPIGDSGTTFWNTTPTFGTPPHSGTTFWNTPTFGTPPHRGFWDNFLEYHPTFWNTTPSSRGDNFLEHHPNTTPSTQQREHQPARVGVLVQPLEHQPTGPDRESGTLTGGADQPLVAAGNNHVCTTFR